MLAHTRKALNHPLSVMILGALIFYLGNRLDDTFRNAPKTAIVEVRCAVADETKAREAADKEIVSGRQEEFKKFQTQINKRFDDIKASQDAYQGRVEATCTKMDNRIETIYQYLLNHPPSHSPVVNSGPPWAGPGGGTQ